jgi:Rho GTPase-activating protein 17
MFNDLNIFTHELGEQVLKPLVDYQKEVSLLLKENRKELKEAYDKVEQCRRNLDKAKKDVDTSRRQLDLLRSTNAESKKQNEQSRLLIQSEDKKLKFEKELDECERVAIERYDKYTEGLYKNVSEEPSLATYFLDYLKLQQKYHSQVFNRLEHIIPQLSGKITQFTRRTPSFGVPLEDHIIDSNSLLSPIIYKLIENMKKQNAHLEEGIFRIAGSRIKMNCLISSINAGYLDSIDFNEFDVHCLASVLKQYLRDLPDSLLCNSLHDDWSLAVNSSSSNLKQQAFLNVLSRMPKINYENLRYIVKFLSQIADNSSMTKMNSNNIGICFGASLLNTQIALNNTSSSIQTNTIDMSIATSAFEYLVSHHNDLFPSNDTTTSSSSSHSSPLSPPKVSSPFKYVETLLPQIRVHTPETVPKNNSFRSSMMVRVYLLLFLSVNNFKIKFNFFSF